MPNITYIRQRSAEIVWVMNQKVKDTMHTPVPGLAGALPCYRRPIPTDLHENEGPPKGEPREYHRIVTVWVSSLPVTDLPVFARQVIFFLFFFFFTRRE